MKKQEVQKIRDDYLHQMSDAYKGNRYVHLDRLGFSESELDMKKIIKHRVEGVDSLAHEMNRRMANYFWKLLEMAE